MTQRFLSKLWAAFLLYLAALPLFALPAAVLMPQSLWLAALLPVAALALTGGAALLPVSRRVPALMGALAIMAALCAVLLMPQNPLAELLFLPCAFVMLYFMPAMQRPAHAEWTGKQLGAGIILHLIAQFLKSMDLFKAASALLTWCCAVYLLACLFAFNRMVLMGNSPTASKTLLYSNRRMLVGFSLLALLLANIKPIGTAIRGALTWVVTAIAKAVLWLTSLFGTSGTESTDSAADMSAFTDLGETTEPSLLSQIMQVIVIVAVAAIVALLLFWALRKLYRLLKKAFYALMEHLQLYRQRISADYSDQSESLLDWSELRQSARQRAERFRRRYMPTPWEKLSPTQRVRRVYTLLLRRPREAPNPALTAQETLQSGDFKLSPADTAALAALYDQARYSDHPITDAQADEARKRTGV